MISLKLRVSEDAFGHFKQKNVTHTSTALVRLTVLRSDPEISRTRVHKNQEVTRRGSDLYGREIPNILASARSYIFRVTIIQRTHSISSPKELLAVGVLAIETAGG